MKDTDFDSILTIIDSGEYEDLIDPPSNTLLKCIAVLAIIIVCAGIYFMFRI